MVYLNTSYVTVKHKRFIGLMDQLPYLNTSYVTVKHFAIYQYYIVDTDLNTSYVTVKQEFTTFVGGAKVSFKYIICYC